MEKTRVYNKFDCMEYIEDAEGNMFSFRLTDTNCFLSLHSNDGRQCEKSVMNRDDIQSKYFMYPFKDMNAAALDVMEGLTNKYLFQSGLRFTEA